MAQLVKTMAGLAIASVKTVNGLAIALVKTVAGLDNTSGGGGGAPEFYQAASGSTGPSQSITTSGALTNGYAVFIDAYTPFGGTDTATFNGSAMSLLGTISGGGRTCKIWGLSVGDLAAGTYTGATALDNFSDVPSVLLFNNVNQFTSTGTASTQTDQFGSSPSVSVSSASGELVIAVLAQQEGETVTGTGAGQTTRNTTSRTCVTDKAGAITSTTMSYTLSASNNYGLAGFALKPV